MQPDDQSANQSTNESGVSAVPPVKKSKKKLLAAVLLVLALVTVGVGAGLHAKSKDTTTKQDSTGLSASNNPAHVKGIAVNTYPYAAACPVFDSKTMHDTFGGVSNSSLIDTTYAEDGLPAKDIAKNRNNGAVETSCSRTLGSDTAYAGAAVIFKIYEYPTTTAAKNFYKLYDQTQAEKDQQKKYTGVNVNADYAALDGAANTMYSPANSTSYTLDGNKVLSFSAASIEGPIPQDTYKQNIAQALPIIEAHIQANSNDGRSLQQQPQEASFGKKIGDSTIMNPCAFFTGDDFYKGNGTKPNPAEVRSTFNFQADTYFPEDVHNGWATNSCAREQYPQSGDVMYFTTAQLQYYKTAAEAAQYVRQSVAERTNDPDFQQTAQEVQGVGDYAAYMKPTGTATLSYFYVQKGPYVLRLDTNVVTPKDSKQHVATSQQYQKMARVLVPKLK